MENTTAPKKMVSFNYLHIYAIQEDN